MLRKIGFFHRSIIITFLFSMMASILNYGFQIIMGNMLSVEEFGLYNSINSFAANLVVVFTPLSIMICQVTATKEKQRDSYRGVILQIFGFAGAIMFLILTIGGGLYGKIESKLGVQSIVSWLIILMMIGISGFYNIAYAIIQGLRKFVVYGIVGVALVAIKCIFSVINIYLGMGVAGIVYAMLVSYVIMLLAVCIFVYKAMPKTTDEPSKYLKRQDIMRLWGVTFIAQLLSSFYINGGEIMLMSLWFDDKEVGLYSSAITLGKVSLYLISALSAVLLPTIASKRDDKDETKIILYRSLCFCLLLTILYVIFLFVAGERFIVFFYGRKYEDAMKYIPYVSGFIIPLNLLSVVHNYFIGIGKVREYVVYFGLATVAAIAIICTRVTDVRYVPVVLGIALVVALIVALLYIRKRI